MSDKYTITKNVDTDFKGQPFLRYHIQTNITLSNCVARLVIGGVELASQNNYALTAETGGYYFDIKISAEDTKSYPVGDRCGIVWVRETITSGNTTTYKNTIVDGKIPFIVQDGVC